MLQGENSGLCGLHRIVVQWRLDGSQSYRPYPSCECGWMGRCRSSYATAVRDALDHRLGAFHRPPSSAGGRTVDQGARSTSERPWSTVSDRRSPVLASSVARDTEAIDDAVAEFARTLEAM